MRTKYATELRVHVPQVDYEKYFEGQDSLQSRYGVLSKAELVRIALKRFYEQNKDI